MTQLDIWHIERDRTLPLSYLHHMVRGCEQELGVHVNELPDEPGTGNPVDLDALTSDPLHSILHSVVHGREQVPASTSPGCSSAGLRPNRPAGLVRARLRSRRVDRFAAIA